MERRKPRLDRWPTSWQYPFGPSALRGGLFCFIVVGRRAMFYASRFVRGCAAETCVRHFESNLAVGILRFRRYFALRSTGCARDDISTDMMTEAEGCDRAYR